MNKPLPEISGRSHSGEVLAPFSTSPKPFHDSESYYADVTASITVDSSTDPLLPIPVPSPSMKAAQAMAKATSESSPAPVPTLPPPAVENEGEGNLATPPIRAGMPLLPFPRPESSSLSPLAVGAAGTSTSISTKPASLCASTSGTSISSSGAIEGGAFSATTNTETYSSSPPAAGILGAAETHTTWSPSSKRAAARHPMRPIYTSYSSSPTAAPAGSGSGSGAAAVAAAVPGGGGCNPHTSSLALPTGFSHKFRRRLLDAPGVEEQDSATTAATAATAAAAAAAAVDGPIACHSSSGHKQQRRGSDVAAAAAAAIAATVTVSSDGGIGPADDVVKRPGLLRRCMSLMEESPSSRCPSLAVEDNDQGVGGIEPGRGTASAGVRISRSTSWEPFSGISFEPPRGFVHHRRPSIPSPQNKGGLSSLSGKCELGSTTFGGSSPSPSSKGINPPPAMPALAPATVGLVFASSTLTRSSSFCGSDGGLRMSPLQRSDSMCSVSDADPEEEAHAASFFLSGSGSLGSDGAPQPPSPTHSCSPLVASRLNDTTHAGGKNIQIGVSRGGGDGRRPRGVGARSAAKPSPCHERGRSVDSAPSFLKRQQQQQDEESRVLSNADTPKLNRHSSYFERKARAAQQESAPTRRRDSGRRNEDGRECPEQRVQARQKSEQSGCRRRAPISGTTEGSASSSSTAPLPARVAGEAGSGASGGRTGVLDQRSDRKHYLMTAGNEHEPNLKDNHNAEQSQHLLLSVSSVGGIAKHLPDQPATSSSYSISEQTAAKPETCAHRSLVERHEPSRRNHGNDLRGGNQALGAASSGGGGGGNLPASSSQGAGGAAVANHAQVSSSLMVRRNDSILKSLLAGGSFDPVVGSPKKSSSVGASYEFGLWKKKGKGRDEVPPFSTTAATRKTGQAQTQALAQGEAGLPPPPTKGLPTRPGVLEPFPRDIRDVIRADVAGARAGRFSARTGSELLTTMPRGEPQQVRRGDGGAGRRRSPLPANRVLAKLPARCPSGGNPPDTAVSSSNVRERAEPEPTSTEQPTRTAEGVLRRVADAPRPSEDPKGSDSNIINRSLSNSRRNSRTSLWPLAQGSAPNFSPSPSPPPSPFPSPRKSPRLSPRAARAGTRPCTELPLSGMPAQPGGPWTTGKDLERLRGLKASPPFNASSRFPVTSHVPRQGGREGENQGRDRRGSRTSCRHSAFSNSAGNSGWARCGVDDAGRSSSPQQVPTPTPTMTGVCCCPASPVAGGDYLSVPFASHEAARRSASTSPIADVNTTLSPGLAPSTLTPTERTDAGLHPLLNPEADARLMADREIVTEGPRDPLDGFPEEQMSSHGFEPAAAATPDDTPSTSTQSLPGGGQNILVDAPNSRKDRSESLTVEVSADYSSDLSQDSDSDSGRGSCGRGRSLYGDGSELGESDHEGCHTSVSRHPRRHAFHWKRGEQIGMGSFGKVFKGLNESTGELFAVKQISLTRGQKEEINTLETEIDLMKDLDHRHIVRYCGTDRGTRHLYIFLEYVPGGSIASMLQQFGVFREDLVRRFMHQILLGTRYLHDKGIIHRDIKGANVLVTEQGIAKLADFGCSKQFQGVRTPSFDDSLHTIRGSIPWMAPEMVKQTGHGRSADVWSVGATMIEMYTARYPWPPFSNNMAAMYHVATTTEPPKFPKGISSEANDFLSKCLIIDPDARLKASQLLQHPFLIVAEAALEASSGQGPGGFGAYDGSMEERRSDHL